MQRRVACAKARRGSDRRHASLGAAPSALHVIWHHTWYHMPVHKTTLYLPDELKRAVANVAAVSGTSEASVIREAIAALARTVDRPHPRGVLFRSGDPTLSTSTEAAMAGFAER